MEKKGNKNLLNELEFNDIIGSIVVFIERVIWWKLEE